MKQLFVRYGMAVLAIACAGAASSMAGCSSDDTSKDGGSDASNTDDNVMPPPDSGSVDAPVDMGAPLGKPKLILVHGSPDVGPIRVCFATMSGVTPLPALPHELTAAQMQAGVPFPGIYPGTGGPFPDTGTDVSTLGAITPYVMVASKIATHIKGEMPSEKVCSDMIAGADAGGLGLVEGTDYFKLPTIPANTFQKGKTYLLVAIGCTANANFGQLTAARCGGAPGNLGVQIFELDSNVQSMTKNGAQYVHASAIVQAAFPGGVIGSVLTPQMDGGVGVELINQNPVNYKSIAPMKAAQVNPIANNAAIGSAVLASDGGVAGIIPLPVTAIETLTTGAAPTGAYGKNDNFVFVAIGDPTRKADGTPYVQPDGGSPISVNTGYAFHLLGFSANPVVPPLK